MTRPFHRALWLSIPVLSVMVGGCVVRTRTVGYVEPTYHETYVAGPPPAPIVEYRPMPPPGYATVWIDGYWDWSGYDWYWVNGTWASARPGFVYVRPQVVVHGGRHLYHRGYWHGHDGRRDYDYGRPAPRHAPPAQGWRSAPSASGPNQGWRGMPSPQSGQPGTAGTAPSPRQAPPVQGWRGTAPGNAPVMGTGPGNTPPPGWQGSPGPASRGQGGPVFGQPSPGQGSPGQGNPVRAAPPPMQGGWKATPAPPAPSPPPPPPSVFGQSPGNSGNARRAPAYIPGQPAPASPVREAEGPGRATRGPSSAVQGPARLPPKPAEPENPRRRPQAPVRQ
jgi:hypothetical protein